MTNEEFIKEYNYLSKTLIKYKKELEKCINRQAMLEAQMASAETQLTEMKYRYNEIQREIMANQEKALSKVDKQTVSIFTKIKENIQALLYKVFS